MPRSRASSTARLDGAPTATIPSRPASAAFCTSSNDARPLTHATTPASGKRPAMSCAPLAREEADRQLLVLARRAHRHRERRAVDADLERLLDRQLVLDPLAAAVADALDPCPRHVRVDGRRHVAYLPAGDWRGTPGSRQ